MTKPDSVREVATEYLAPSLRLTYDDYCQIPPGHQRYELIGGVLRVVPSPSVAHHKEANIWGAPDLVVEVLSPGTAGWDRKIKCQTYARFGIRELWLADPESRSIEVATLKDGDLSTAGVYPLGSTLVSPILPGFELNIDTVFP
ncbi:MAG: Uma2 family endonuclease [Firmicutes bacterium]|nr:Uma2 family endonuclease [Bacillota bacterium]